MDRWDSRLGQVLLSAVRTNIRVEAKSCSPITQNHLRVGRCPAGWLVVQYQEFESQGLPCQCNIYNHQIMVQEVQEYSHTKD